MPGTAFREGVAKADELNAPYFALRNRRMLLITLIAKAAQNSADVDLGELPELLDQSQRLVDDHAIVGAQVHLEALRAEVAAVTA